MSFYCFPVLTEFTCFVLVGTLDIILNTRKKSWHYKHHIFATLSMIILRLLTVRCNSISVWRSIPAHRVAISQHVYRAVNFLSISLHSGADSRIVREAIKTRLHEWNVGSIDCSAACWYACTCYCVQPGRGRRFGVYRACDFRRIDKTWNSWLA